MRQTSSCSWVRPAAGQPGNDSDPVAKLEDDLIVRQTMLNSLLDLPESPDIVKNIKELKAEIATIGKQLGELNGTNGESSQARDQIQHPMPSYPSAMSSPYDSRPGTPSFRRKRSLGSSHLTGAATGRPESKSRRSTPVTPYDALSDDSNFMVDDAFPGEVIDLTGDDDNTLKVVLSKHRQEIDRASYKKAMADSDAVLARQLAQDNWPPQGGSSYSQPSQPRQGGGAFDRLMNRTSQHSSVKSEPGLPYAAHTAPVTAPIWAQGVNGIKTEPGSSTSSRDADFGQISGLGARRIKSENLPSLHSIGLQTGATLYSNGNLPDQKPWNGDTKPAMGRSQMPGAYVDSDEEDGSGMKSSFLQGLPKATRPQWPNLTRPSHVALPQRPAGVGHSQHSQFQLASAMEYTRKNGLASQPFGGTHVYSQHRPAPSLPSPFPDYNSPLNPPGFNRPGYLQNGKSAAIDRSSYYNYDTMTDKYGNCITPEFVDFLNNPPGTAGLREAVKRTTYDNFDDMTDKYGNHTTPEFADFLNNPPGQAGLREAVNRTNHYNFDDMTDMYGNPLTPELADFINNYVDDPRKTEAEIRDLLSNIRPDMDIPEEERGETPKALKYPLYIHQQLALKWMTDMEMGTNKGGILADDMGLGKTISTLALMVTRKATQGPKTNLIIGPVALIKQWEMEIKKKLKSEHRLSVFLLHQKKVSYNQIKGYDVVLTTYGSVASEWRQYQNHIEQRKASEGYDPANDEPLQVKCPLVHPKSRFYRVILDEAQCIKNKETQSSKGAHLIEATYRWCLTGTPMMNGVQELFPLIRFLRIKPYCEQKRFTDSFKGLITGKTRASDYQKSEAMRKLQAVLKAIMLRRMKSSEIDGKPILVLPPKTREDEFVVFSEDEKKFYQDLEARSQVQFNKYLRQGTVGKNYSNILVLLLRLRQACCHPHLMDFECVGANEVSEDQMLNLAKTLDRLVIERIKAIEAFECPICYDAVEDPTLIIPCGHDTCSECFTSLTDQAARGDIRSGNESVAAKCPVCRGPVEPLKIINYKTFQKAHMPEKVPPTDPTPVGDDVQSDTDSSDTDPDSDLETERDDDDVDANGNLKDFVVPDDEVGDEDSDANIEAEFAAAAEAKKAMKSKKAARKAAKSTKKQASRKGKEKAGPKEIKPHQLGALRHEAGKNKEARRRYMHYLRDNWEDSAKVTQVVELLKEIQKTDEKTIIFSQWTALLDLIECQVKYTLGLKYCRYTGGMSRTQRDEAVSDFVQNPRNTVMLVSLRAGNAGLNLTVASRVIICDPFWNPYIEMQAVDRAHRIGQQREVKIHRILVQGTVEDRILELQKKKQDLVEAALDEGEMKNLGRLSENELRYLFGVKS